MIESVILEKVRQIVASYCKEAVTQLRNALSAVDVEGGYDVWDAERETAKDAVVRSIVEVGQRAWIAEFGKGSLMASGSENPFLEDYISGKVKDADGNPLFNSERLGHALAITGRKHGYYYDLDGNRYHSHGVLAGKVIEDNSSGKYRPSAPKFIARKILFDGGIMTGLLDDIQNAIMQSLIQFMNESVPKEIILYDER